MRELEEELNIAAIGPPPCYPGSLVSPEEVEANHLRFLFDCIVTTALNRCRVRVFDVAVTDELASTISFQASEVQGGEFESLSCVKRAATESLQQLTTQISGGNNENGVRVFVTNGRCVECILMAGGGVPYLRGKMIGSFSKKCNERMGGSMGTWGDGQRGEGGNNV